MPCQVDGCNNGGKLVRGWCVKHYNRWKRRKTVEPLGATPETVDLWRRAHADGIRPYIEGLWDAMWGPPPPDDWQPSEATKAWWRRKLGLEERPVDEQACYCGELVNAAGVHTATSDVRCFPDENLPDRAEVPPSAA